MSMSPEQSGAKTSVIEDAGRALKQYWSVLKPCGPVLKRCWPLILIGITFVVIHIPLLKIWWMAWTAPYSYFSHGPLIPFIVAYMVWANKNRLKAVDIRPSWFGYVLLVFSGLLFVLGSWTLGGTTRAVAFVVMILAAMLVTLGSRVTKILAVPVAFILTMIPVSPSWLDGATGKLQLQSAAFASKFLLLAGYDAVLKGTTIYSSDLPQPLIVGMPCSGLRTLISLVAFTVFFVYLVRDAKWKKVVLLATAFPLSMFINSLRIAMIGFVGIWTYSGDAMHSFHDYSGYIGLVICFAILFGIAKLLKADAFGILDLPPDSQGRKAFRPQLIGGSFPGLAVFVVFVLSGLSIVFTSPIYPQTKGHFSQSAIPVSFEGWVGRDVPIQQDVIDAMPAGIIMDRSFTKDTEPGEPIEVFINCARNPDAFHDPHVCLPGGGQPISDDRIITLHVTKPRPMTISASLLKTQGDFGKGWVLCWYMMHSDSMPTTQLVWARHRANMFSDLGRLAVKPWNSSAVRNDVEKRQFTWYRLSKTIGADDAADLQQLERFATGFVANTKGFGE